MIWTVSGALLGLLALSLPVGVVLFLLGLGVDQFYTGFPLIRGMGERVWQSSNSGLLIAIPFFVLLGELLVRSGIAARTYRALDAWFSWLPGGLIHANVGTATMFSATSGSSVATAATVATVAMPQAERLGYDQRLFAGAIAAGGTLGIMIPPSINLIIYGFLTETSIPRLFLAGLVPGLALALLFMAVAALICWYRPHLGGPARRATWAERVRGLRDLIPLLALFGVVIGSIYAGWATPTESAAIGVAMAAAIAALNRGLSLSVWHAALLGTVRTTAMVMFVIVGAYFLNYTLAAAGLGRQLQALLDGLGMGPYQTLLAVILLYIVLGFFIETMALMIATIPIVVPVIVGHGFDPIWFGILMIVLIEMALITPPVGLNLYVVQAARTGGRFTDVMVGAVPFVLAMLLMVALLVLFPQIALWLPSL